MKPHQTAATRWKEEHIAATEQVLGAHRVENGPGVEARTHPVGDPAGEVGLDDAGEDVDRRTLGCTDQVDAHCARLLCEPGDGLFDGPAGCDHQISELVDHDHDVGQRGKLEIVPVDLFGELLLRPPQLDRVPHELVVLLQVADTERRQNVVAAIHLGHRPPQSVGCLLGVGDDRRQEVGNVGVHAELHHLGVDRE